MLVKMIFLKLNFKKICVLNFDFNIFGALLLIIFNLNIFS